MICAHCDHFTLKPAKDDAEHREYVEMGLGRCKLDPGFDSGDSTIYRAWNMEMQCGTPARDMAKREVWILKQEGDKNHD